MSNAITSLLDNVRLSNGPECLRNYYAGIAASDHRKALELLNDPGLSFASLYVLRYDLKALASSTAFDPMRYTALRLTDLLSYGKDIKTEAAIRSGGSKTKAALFWMMHTGYKDESLGRSYDALMDSIAALLTKSFKDTSALPDMIDLAFMRHRAGREIHDIIWAFFEACSPESLFYIADRLDSGNSADAELAKKLLHFVPSVSEGKTDNASLCISVRQWLSDNLPFLHYSGESLNLSPQPEYYILSLDCKYLCHAVSPKTGQPLQALRYTEQQHLQDFSSLPRHMQLKLSDFSYALFRANAYKWNMWITLPVTQQIAIAMSGSEVR